MKERILTGWNFQRIVFLIIGIAIITQATMDKAWMGLFLGGYVTSMAVFAFGCASGNCNVPKSNTKVDATTDIDFEEVK